MDIKIVWLVFLLLFVLMRNKTREETFQDAVTRVTIADVANVGEMTLSFKPSPATFLDAELEPQALGSDGVVTVSFEIGDSGRAHFVVLGKHDGWIHCVVMSDDREKEGTITVRQKRLLRGFVGEIVSIVVKVRRDLKIDLQDPSFSLIVSARGESFILKHTSSFPQDKYPADVDHFYCPAILGTHTMSRVMEVAQKLTEDKNTQVFDIIPPICYVQFEKKGGTVDHSILKGVLSEGCAPYLAREAEDEKERMSFDRGLVSSIILLGSDLRADPYFYDTVRNISSWIPIPSEIFDMEENVRKYAKEPKKTCGDMMPTVRFSQNAITDDEKVKKSMYKAVGMERAAACLGASTLDKLPIDTGEDGVFADESQPCEITYKYEQIPYTNKTHRADCTLKEGMQDVEARGVFPPGHPVWEIPEPPPFPDTMKLVKEMFLECTYEIGTANAIVEGDVDHRKRLIREFEEMWRQYQQGHFARIIFNFRSIYEIKSYALRGDDLVFQLASTLRTHGKNRLAKIRFEPR
jgi:hypothetical protein